MDIDPIGVRGVGATRYTYTAIRSGIHGESQGFRRLCKFLIHRICGSCGRRSSGRWWGAGAAARPGATDLREPEGGDASGAQRRPACRSVQPRSTHRHRRCRSRGAKQTRRLREIGNPIHVIAFSLDGQLVAAGAGRGAVQIWQDLASHDRNVSEPVQRHAGEGPHGRVRPSHQARRRRGRQGLVIVANTVQGMPETSLEGTRGVVMAVNFDLTSLRIIGAIGDGTARVWDATSPYRQLAADLRAAGWPAPAHDPARRPP